MVRFAEFVLPISIKTWRRTEGSVRKKQKDRRRRERSCRRDRAWHQSSQAPSLAHQKGRCEEKHRGAQGPLIALNRSSRKPGVNVTGLHFRESVSKELLHRARSVFKMKIKSAGALRDSSQTFFVQLRFHDLPRAVFDEGGPAPFTIDRNERAFRGADTDCENPHAGVRRRLRALQRIAAQLLAIRKNDYGPIADSALAKCAHGQSDRIRDIRAAFRNCIGVEIVDRFDRRVVVDRKRSLQKRAARKRDQTHAISLELVDEILHGQFHALKAVRLHIV